MSWICFMMIGFVCACKDNNSTDLRHDRFVLGSNILHLCTVVVGDNVQLMKERLLPLMEKGV